jgi:23S rRNA (uridine2552-2'-O)-methyltransferase
MARSKSSQAWLKEHFQDTYVKMAQQQGYRSRAAFKLLEIQERDRLIRPGMHIVDLGAAPGGWSQVVSQLLKHHGKIVALDLLAMPALDHVTFLQGDFREEAMI